MEKHRIFTSQCDQDLYKFHMGSIFWDHFQGTQTEYAYKCRDKTIDLSPIYTPLCEQIEMMQDITLTKEEEKYLFENTKATQDYLINFLRSFRFRPDQVIIKKISDKPGLSIRPTGPVEVSSLWEMPMMYTISELWQRYVYGDKFDMIVNRAEVDLHYKVKELLELLEKNPLIRFLFSEFGTRRRLCRSFQEYAIEYLKNKLPTHLVGTSNVMFAKKFGLKAVGTCAHEFYQFYQGFHHVLDSQKCALIDWIEFYRGWLGIALTDTLGSNKWDKDFDKDLMIDYLGQRHDSADPYKWADRRIAAYKREEIDPKEKTLLFSDNLTFKSAFDLSVVYEPQVNASHGLGTFITCNIPSVPNFKALNQVLKLVKANGRDVIKISDDPMKNQCENEIYANYVKHVVEL